MTNPDVWAAAEAAQRQTTNPPASTPHTTAAAQQTSATDGVNANPVADAANPFLTSQDANPGGGGQFDPFVPNSYLEGRMVVMVPKRFTDKDPKPESMGGGLRDKWIVDIVILDGGPFEFTYKTKENRDSTELTEKTYTVDSFPATFRGQSIWAGQLIGALNGANTKGAFIYGEYSKVPVLQDARAGLTVEQLYENIAQWRRDMAAGKPGTPNNMPRHTYNLLSTPDKLTPARINLATAWWEQEKANRLNAGS